MNQLQILSPDGASHFVALDRDSFAVGRSRDMLISFPDDNGLSRHHLTIERAGGEWSVRDESSRNGTLLHGERIAAAAALKTGDRISAGHLIIVCRDSSMMSSPGSDPVVVFDPAPDSDTDSGKTVFTDLGSIGSQTGEAGPARHSDHAMVSALLRAGNELAGHRPLPELFRYILDLSIKTVSASRGVLLTLDDGELVVRANKGEGFHISTAVRDRVLNSGVSVLVRDTTLDDGLRDRASILEQNIRTLTSAGGGRLMAWWSVRGRRGVPVK